MKANETVQSREIHSSANEQIKTEAKIIGASHETTGGRKPRLTEN